MTPKEKAKDIVEKYNNILPCEGNTTGQTPIDCALICVDEVLSCCFKSEIYFWEEIRNELKKM